MSTLGRGSGMSSSTAGSRSMGGTRVVSITNAEPVEIQQLVPMPAIV